MSLLDNKLKSNDLGAFLEDGLRNALLRRGSLFWRLHTPRSFKGVDNPCDFLVLDKEWTALIECKATNDESFSCASFQQLKHFEKSAQFAHKGLYGVLVCFYSEKPIYVFATDKKVMENKEKRRPIRAMRPETYDCMSVCLDDLLEYLKSDD